MAGLQAKELQETLATSLTVVRIKRRRDDPTEPEIILEAAGDRRNKQPRYDDLLLQFQGMSFMGAVTAPAPEARRRRFRCLRTIEVSTLESMTDSQLLQLLRARPSTPSPGDTASAGSAEGQPGPQPEAADSSQGRQPEPEPLGHLKKEQAYTLGSGFGAAGPGSGPPAEAAQRRDVKGSEGPSRAGCISTLRESHRMAGAAARYKQIRRRRGPDADDEEAASALHMYDLERLPTSEATRGKADRRAGGNGSTPSRSGQAAAEKAERPKERGPAPVQQQQEQAARREQAASAAGPSVAADESLILEHFGPLVSEYLREHSQEQQQHVRRIPARPRCAQPAPPRDQQLAAPAGTHAPSPQAPDAASRQAETPQRGGSEATEAPAVGPNRDGTCAGSAVAAPQPSPREGGSGGGGDSHSDSYVYDVYVPVSDEAMEGEREGRDEVPWVDSPSGPDLLVPVIEVAENDDEFFWAGELEMEAAQRAALAEEHDSEDSNAESYYANSYPDEEGAPYGGYGNDAGTDDGDSEMEEAEPADADAGGYGWGTALAMRRGERPSDDDEDAEDGDDDNDEEIFGRRRRRLRPMKKVTSYYRTENDDYSEHSSFLSEEEERREAEERRRRAIYTH